MNPAFEDGFNLLCGKKLGEGIHRDVFVCRLNHKWVVKVETDGPWRYFANVHEMKFWNDNQHVSKIANWLAPCEYLSPDGLVMIQHRVEPVSADYPLPAKLPSFLTDIKTDNFGMLNGKLVCFDYAMSIQNPSLRLKKADWARSELFKCEPEKARAIV